MRVEHWKVEMCAEAPGEEGMIERGMSKREWNEPRGGLRAGLVAALVIVVMGAVWAGRAAGLELYQGERFRATLDSTFTTGIALRVEKRADNLFYKGNDPEHPNAGQTPGFFSNADDGDLNYNQGDLYSGSISGTFEFETNYRVDGAHVRSIGSFVRANGFYDFVASDPGRTQRTALSDDARHRSAVTDGGVVGGQWIFLDMYVDGRFDLLNRYADVRVGNQVLNWGEGIFTPGGISSTNAFDVTKLRIPGSELREAFVPAPIIRVSLELIKNLGLETYYQVYWNKTHVDPVGSYWATSDLVGRGAEALMLGNDPGGTGLTAEELIAQGRAIPRKRDDKPSNQGQFGVALRYYVDRIMTDFGVYYIRYHSKTPTVGNQAGFKMGQPAPLNYFREYADKIEVVGVSSAREILNATVAGEVSYRWGDSTPLVATGSALANAVKQVQSGVNPNDVLATGRGYSREKRLQAMVNMIQILGPSTRWGVGQLVEASGADSFSLISEMAVNYYPDLSKQCSTPFQPLIDVFSGQTTNCVAYAGPGPPDTDELVSGNYPVKSGVDDVSLGYQVLLRGEYTNPMNIPITINPTVSWGHNFYGTSPNQTFVENRKSVSLGVVVDYLQVWQGSFTYGSFFGGGRENLTHDRDFVSFSLTYRL